MVEIINIMRYSRVPLELNTKPGDKVLVLVDTLTNPLVWQSLAAAAFQLGADPIVNIMMPRAYPHQDPPKPVVESIRSADLTILAPSKAILHCVSIHKLMKKGCKFIAMEEITPEMLMSGGATANYIEMQKVGERIRNVWAQGKKVRVTSEEGTNLTAVIEGRHGYYVAGKVIHQPGMDLYCAAFPDGEAGVSPIEGTGEGVVFFDTSINFVGLIKEKIKVIVKKGKVVKIEGGVQAKQLEEAIKEYGDENTYNFPAEISIGINPNAIVRGVIREDKKLLGAVHIAFGMNADTGGITKSKLHIDGIVRKPTVEVDKKVIVEKGKLLL